MIEGSFHRIVDIANKTCTCCVWQLDDFPCTHAAAALYRRNLKPIDFVPDYYTQKNYEATYSQDVFPIEHDGDWNLLDDDEVIPPPILKRQSGRPKMKRYRSKHELFQPYHVRCGSCGKPGHNKRGCKAV